jgi:hypothetical protein
MLSIQLLLMIGSDADTSRCCTAWRIFKLWFGRGNRCVYVASLPAMAAVAMVAVVVFGIENARKVSYND